MDSQLDWLIERLTRLEDLLAVHETVAGYGPTIDGGLRSEGGMLWTEDCIYDSNAVGASGGYQTRDAIESLIENARDAELGFAHITHLPVVVVDGDRATAYAASHLPIARDGGAFEISRVSANKWDLIRADGHWQMQRRTSRTLDGSPDAKRLFAEAARSARTERETAQQSEQSTSSPEGCDMSTEKDLAAMDRRISNLEDKLAILQVVAGYGPSIDGGAAREAGSLWTEDCWYDSDAGSAGTEGVHGRAAIESVSMRCGEAEIGLAHISHMPLIEVDGDHATVVNHSNTFHQEGEGFRIGRVSSNRWDLVRVDGSWQIQRRVNRLLNGSRESKEVFAEGTSKVLASQRSAAQHPIADT
jgi:hypothetical protein